MSVLSCGYTNPLKKAGEREFEFTLKLGRGFCPMAVLSIIGIILSQYADGCQRLKIISSPSGRALKGMIKERTFVRSAMTMMIFYKNFSFFFPIH